MYKQISALELNLIESTPGEVRNRSAAEPAYHGGENFSEVVTAQGA